MDNLLIAMAFTVLARTVRRLRKLTIRPDACLCMHAPEEAVVTGRHCIVVLGENELPFPPK